MQSGKIQSGHAITALPFLLSPPCYTVRAFLCVVQDCKWNGMEILANSVVPLSKPFKYFLSSLYYQPSITLKSNGSNPSPQNHDLNLFLQPSSLCVASSALYTACFIAFNSREIFSIFLQKFSAFLQFNRFQKLGFQERTRYCLDRVKIFICI